MSAAATAPDLMSASVYRGAGRVIYEQVGVPEIGRGEILVKVAACGICHTDLKKIEYDLLTPPRIYGHETAGTVAAVGAGVTKFQIGDRVCVFHHIPCRDCFYCRHKDYAQCARYIQVGVTAGFEPAGGGFAQYVRVMDWIVDAGVEKVPDGVSFERGTFVEPLNTCLKGIEKCALSPDETVLIMGQGPIGLLFTMLLKQRGLQGIYASDRLPERLAKAEKLGAIRAWDPTQADIAAELRATTSGRGADVVIVAASAPGIVEQAVALTRPGARIMLFAQTSSQEKFELDGAGIGKNERMVFGSYSASVDLQRESAEIVWREDFPVEDLISHRLPLAELERGIEIARRPQDGSLKVLVYPQEQG
jgi:L-iditol 2-dehydrogenase